MHYLRTDSSDNIVF